MSNEISVNGECHCGNISISAIVDKNKVRVCHCTDCQKMSGAPFRAIAIASADKIKITGTSSHSNAYLIIRNYELNDSKSFYDYSGDFKEDSNPLLSSETTITKTFTSIYTTIDISLKIYYDKINTQNVVISNIELIPITSNNIENNAGNTTKKSNRTTT